VVIVILILVLAVALVALGIGLSRRDQRRSAGRVPGERPGTRAPSRPPASPPAPVAATSAEPELDEPVDEVDLVEVDEIPLDEIPLAEIEVTEDDALLELVEEAPVEPVVEREEIEEVEEEVARPRLRDRLGKTRAAFAKLRTRATVDEETLEELEDTLLLADVGIPTTTRVLDGVSQRARDERVTDGDGVMRVLHEELVSVLAVNPDRTLRVTPGEMNVWMFVGVNGVGKTTTIAKVAQREIGDGHSVVLAAADTFRAAAAEQLSHWAERTGAGIVRGQEGADPGSVVFDAMSSAESRDADLVLVDTAGRLHTKTNLMAELEKMRRIVDRTPGALKEVLLVLDATTGQNGLTQARQFADAVDVTGVVLTKLDGTAKGGIVLAIESELGIPVKLVGVGESAADLIDFDPEEFVEALFAA
jgi:fused signal recognition particle receptor